MLNLRVILSRKSLRGPASCHLLLQVISLSSAVDGLPQEQQLDGFPQEQAGDPGDESGIASSNSRRRFGLYLSDLRAGGGPAAARRSASQRRRKERGKKERAEGGPKALTGEKSVAELVDAVREELVGEDSRLHAVTSRSQAATSRRHLLASRAASAASRHLALPLASRCRSRRVGFDP
jgi:hypothetical protein